MTNESNESKNLITLCVAGYQAFLQPDQAMQIFGLLTRVEWYDYKGARIPNDPLWVELRTARPASGPIGINEFGGLETADLPETIDEVISKLRALGMSSETGELAKRLLGMTSPSPSTATSTGEVSGE